MGNMNQIGQSGQFKPIKAIREEEKNQSGPELEKAGSMGSAEPDFFRFSAKSIWFVAKFVPNFTLFTKLYKLFTKFYQILSFSYQIFHLCCCVGIINCCNLLVFLPPNLYAQKSGLTKTFFFPTLIRAI